MERKWQELSIIIVSRENSSRMTKRGIFEIIYTPEGITARIEPGKDGDVWMTVNDIVKAYGVFYQTVKAGLKALKKSGDFDECQDLRIEKFLYKGKQCSVELYSLKTVIALGFRMNGTVCQLFRKWAASRIAQSYRRKPSALFLCMKGNMVMN